MVSTYIGTFLPPFLFFFLSPFFSPFFSSFYYVTLIVLHARSATSMLKHFSTSYFVVTGDHSFCDKLLKFMKKSCETLRRGQKP